VMFLGYYFSGEVAFSNEEEIVCNFLSFFKSRFSKKVMFHFICRFHISI